MSAAPEPTDLRGYRAKTTGLTWRALGITLPVVVLSYAIIIAAVHGLFLIWPHPSADEFIVDLVTIAPFSVILYNRFMLRLMGSSLKEEKREQVWAPSSEMMNLAGRQVWRFLTTAYPVLILGLLIASRSVYAIFHAFGLK